MLKRSEISKRPAVVERRMRTLSMLATVGAVLATIGSASVANAGLSIIPNGAISGVQATNEDVLDGGLGFPCTQCTASNQAPGPGNPITTYAYGSGAELVVTTTGNYLFTFEGSGDSANTNHFAVTGGGTFTSVGPGGTGTGSSPAGSTFMMFLTAGTVIPFTLSSSDGCSIADGAAASPAHGCNSLIALANSPTSPGATGPQSVAWVGFDDQPGNQGVSGDTDGQDMVVMVSQVPEPLSIALLGIGIAGLGVARRRTV